MRVCVCVGQNKPGAVGSLVARTRSSTASQSSRSFAALSPAFRNRIQPPPLVPPTARGGLPPLFSKTDGNFQTPLPKLGEVTVDAGDFG